MKTAERLVMCVILGIIFYRAVPAWAGPYTDDLSKCIVESTTPEDRAEFVKWMFAAASKHPAVKSIASVTDEQLDEANKKTAALFMRLLTESCKEKVEKAVRYEGQIAISISFEMLGKIAGQELFASAEVAESMNGFLKYLDDDKLQALMGTEEKKP